MRDDSGPMHDDEVRIDADRVRRLLRAQQPDLADLPLAPVASAGTDHALFRLGDALAVRLPRIAWAADQPAKEALWLPRLAPHLPLAVPVPRFLGAPGEGYPWAWSVVPWIDGACPDPERPEILPQLAAFVAALHAIDPSSGPAPGAHNSGRGVPLAARDPDVRAALEQLDGTIDTRAAARAWERALAAPVHAGPPVWIHGDLHPGNLLAARGRLRAVLDFGCLGVGDPACDLLPAWNWGDGDARTLYRSALGTDDGLGTDAAAWERGRGWALSVALIALPYYRERSPRIAEGALRTLGRLGVY